MHINDDVNVAGQLSVQVFSQRLGRQIDSWSSDNLVVKSARSVLAALIAGEGAPIRFIEFGESDAPAELDDIILLNGYRRHIGGFTYPSPGVVCFDFNLGTHEGNGIAIRELGLLSNSGELFSRKVLRNAIDKTNDISLSGQWTITF